MIILSDNKDPVYLSFRDTKGTFHAKMGSKKDRNGLDLTEVEYINCGEKKEKKKLTP